MMEYVELIFKAVFFYSVIVCALRIMGKREVGELSVLDIVIYFVMSELLALSISQPDESMMKPLTAIITLASLQICVAWVTLKKKKWRDFFEGTPVIIIHNGMIDQNQMRKQRYSIDDLMYQLRDKDISSPDEVQFAILENSGVLTVLKKNDSKIYWPHPLIQDGILQREALHDADIGECWLMDELKKNGCDCVEDVFLCMHQKNGLFILKKEDAHYMKSV